MMGLDVVQTEKLKFIFRFAAIRYYKRNTIVFIKDTSKCFSFLMRTLIPTNKSHNRWIHIMLHSMTYLWTENDLKLRIEKMYVAA